MRWVRPGLWIAAWGVWVCCGFGLYRELPRDPGLPLATIPKGWRGGFIDDTNRLIGGVKDGDADAIQITDAETGAVVSSTDGPSMDDILARRGSLVFARSLGKKRAAEAGPGLFLLDVATGQAKRLSCRRPSQASLHSVRSLLVYTDERTYPDGQVFYVVDFETGAETAVKTQFPNEPWPADATFLPNSDRVVVHTRTDRAHKRPGERMWAELWRLDPPPVRERTFEGISFGMWPAFSSTGLVAFTESLRDADVDVFDLIQGRYVFSDPPREQRTGAFPPIGAPPVISRDGRRLLAGAPAVLWNLETKRALWRPDTFDQSGGGSQQCFAVKEWWSNYWHKLAPKLQYRTYALRSMEDGSLMFRTSADVWGLATGMNQQKTLAVDSVTGRVLRVPFPVNYPLLAISQTILALPLILLWLVLRWRRKRRERRFAGATA